MSDNFESLNKTEANPNVSMDFYWAQLDGLFGF